MTRLGRACTRVAGVVIVVTAVTGVAVTRPRPAHALTEMEIVVKFVSTAYDVYQQYKARGEPSLISQIQTLVGEAQSSILSEIDGLAVNEVRSCTETAIDKVRNMRTMPRDVLRQFDIDTSHCAYMAGEAVGNTTTRAALDKIGFALNAVGPVALLTAAFAGQPVDQLQRNLVDSLTLLRAKLFPRCFRVSDYIDYPGAPLSAWDDGDPVVGHGECLAYFRDDVADESKMVYPFSGPGSGRLPWSVVGLYREPGFLDSSWDAHVDWPPIDDSTIAIDQAMRDTSYAVAGEALSWLQPRGSIGVALGAGGRLELVGTDGADRVWYTYQNIPAARWLGGWIPWDGRLRSVAAAANSNGRMEAFGLDDTGAVFQKWQQRPGGDWSPGWSPMGGTLTSIAATRGGDGRIFLVGTNAQGQIWSKWQREPGGGTGWSAWTQLDGSAKRVAMTTAANGDVVLVVCNQNGEIWQRRLARDPSSNSYAWTGWVRVPGTASSVAAARNGNDGHLDLFALDASGRVLHAWQTSPGGSWSQLTPWGDAPMAALAAATNIDGRIDLYGVDRHGDVFIRWQAWPGGGWSDWQRMPDTGPAVVDVPSVLYLTEAAAAEALEDAGLTVGSVAADHGCTASPGDIVFQHPFPGPQLHYHYYGYPVDITVESDRDSRGRPCLYR
jgi:hypothetical protein